MAALLLHENATVLCQHGGQARATVANQRVKVSGQATAQQATPWMISACPFMTGSVNTPCLTAQWSSGTTRVKSGGQPLLFKSSQATCVPNGTGVNIVTTQMRVKAL
jgi:hypothetical protein